MSRRNRARGGTIVGTALLLLGTTLSGSLLIWTSSGRAAETLPDPTRPPAASRAPAPDEKQDTNEKLTLQAIFHADDRRSAVINGRRMQLADRVAGAELIAIDVDRVRLRRADEIVELELVAPAFKNARKAGLTSATGPSERADDTRPDELRGAMR